MCNNLQPYFLNWCRVTLSNWRPITVIPKGFQLTPLKRAHNTKRRQDFFPRTRNMLNALQLHRPRLNQSETSSVGFYVGLAVHTVEIRRLYDPLEMLLIIIALADTARHVVASRINAAAVKLALKDQLSIQGSTSII